MLDVLGDSLLSGKVGWRNKTILYVVSGCKSRHLASRREGDQIQGLWNRFSFQNVGQRIFPQRVGQVKAKGFRIVYCFKMYVEAFSLKM